GHTRFSRDWSSDVCSSDLQGNTLEHQDHMVVDDLNAVDIKENIGSLGLCSRIHTCVSSKRQARRPPCDGRPPGTPSALAVTDFEDRKSVVYGKRVESGGGR